MALDRIMNHPDRGGEGSPVDAEIDEAAASVDETSCVSASVDVPEPSDELSPLDHETGGSPASRGTRAPREITERLEAQLRTREEQYARELAAVESRANDWERAYKAALREKELATVLSGRPLVPGAAAQLVQLWSRELDVYEENGATRVATRDGRSVAQAVSDWLASPDYAHFCQPLSRGGTNSVGGNRIVSSGSHTPTPRNLGDVAIQQWRDALSMPGAELSAPIGLRRRR